MIIFAKRSDGFTLVEVVIALAIFGMLIGGLLGFLPWGVDGVRSVKDRSIASGLTDAVQIELERLGFSYVEEAAKRLDGLYSITSNTSDAAELNELCLVSPRFGRIVSAESVRVRDQKRISGTGKLVISPDSGTYLSSSMKDMGGKIEFERFKDIPIALNIKPAFGKSENDFKNAGNRWIDEKDRYFLIICRQFAKYPNGESVSPSRHAHHISNGYLALQIEVQWPYKLPSPTDSNLYAFRIVEEKFRSKFTFPLAISR